MRCFVVQQPNLTRYLLGGPDIGAVATAKNVLQGVDGRCSVSSDEVVHNFRKRRTHPIVEDISPGVGDDLVETSSAVQEQAGIS